MIDEVLEDEEIRTLQAEASGCRCSPARPSTSPKASSRCSSCQLRRGRRRDGRAARRQRRGKSTLLKVISGIGLPSAGSCATRCQEIPTSTPSAGCARHHPDPGGARLRSDDGPSRTSAASATRWAGPPLARRVDRPLPRRVSFPPAERRNSLASTLSGGEQQMLGLSKAAHLRRGCWSSTSCPSGSRRHRRQLLGHGPRDQRRRHRRRAGRAIGSTSHSTWSSTPIFMRRARCAFDGAAPTCSPATTAPRGLPAGRRSGQDVLASGPCSKKRSTFAPVLRSADGSVRGRARREHPGVHDPGLTGGARNEIAALASTGAGRAAARGGVHRQRAPSGTRSTKSSCASTRSMRARSISTVRYGSGCRPTGSRSSPR